MLNSAVVNAVVAASDIDRARDFYRDKLGLEPVVDQEGGLLYVCKGSWFLLYPSAWAGTNRATAMGFVVDDLDAEMAALRERGVEFLDYDLPEFTTVDGVAELEGQRGAWFADSEGNIIAVNQITDAAMVEQFRAMMGG
jgi:catechol 2,3-dioxygenase-like lactoylglutathione lyase family enzyme